MKIRVKKTIAAVLILLNVLTLLFGCNMSDKERFIKKIKRSFGGGDSIEITAEPFAQNANAVFSLDVEISEDNIYVEGNLYDKVEYVRNPEIAINGFYRVNKDITDEECFEIIERIKKGKSCYILETENKIVASKVSNKIAVYIIDGVYYFLSFIPNSEEQVGRIRYLKVK